MTVSSGYINFDIKIDNISTIFDDIVNTFIRRCHMIERIDHIVFTVADVPATCNFYERVLGMKVETFGEGRKALCFGAQKINLHQYGNEFEPKAKAPLRGVRTSA